MKTIYINGFSLAAKELYGIQRFTYELLRELDKFIPKGSVAVLIPKESDKDFGFNNIFVIRISGVLGNRIKERLWKYFGFTRYARKHNGLSMDMLLTLPLFGCDIFAFYDCIFEKVDQNFNTLRQKARRYIHMATTRVNLKRSKAVITISKYSKKDIMEVYKIPSQKIALVYTSWEHFNRITPDMTIIDRLGLKKGSYCFSLGSRYYHKNFRWVAAAARQNPQYTFVVSGSDILSSSDSSLNENKPDNMIFTGYISDGEVKALMASCKVFIQPSLYEGAGMPPMEAMSTGARCIVSNRTSLPELYGDSVWYIEPEQYEGIDIDAVMSADIHDNSEVLDRFSWERSAKRLYKVMQDVRKRSR